MHDSSFKMLIMYLFQINIPKGTFLSQNSMHAEITLMEMKQGKEEHWEGLNQSSFIKISLELKIIS